MTYISTNRKWFILTLVVLSFATSLLPHSFAASSVCKECSKWRESLSNFLSSDYTDLITSSDSGDNQPQHHSSSSSTSTNNQHHEHGTGGTGGSDDNEDNNAIVEINTQ